MRGFDTRDLLDPLEQLDVYRDFLGEEEFKNVHSNYLKTIETMDLVFKTEMERIKLADTFSEELSMRNLLQHVEKFDYVFEMLSGKGRE